MLAASPSPAGGEQGVRCQAVVGEVVSLHQQPAVPGTELGTGFAIVPRGGNGEPASPWCNGQECTDAGQDGQAVCGSDREDFHCFMHLGQCWSEKCYIIQY